MIETTLCPGCEQIVIEEEPGKWWEEIGIATEEARKTLPIGEIICNACDGEAEQEMITEAEVS